MPLAAVRTRLQCKRLVNGDALQEMMKYALILVTGALIAGCVSVPPQQSVRIIALGNTMEPGFHDVQSTVTNIMDLVSECGGRSYVHCEFCGGSEPTSVTVFRGRQETQLKRGDWRKNGWTGLQVEDEDRLVIE
jgi:hypothetical protein